jgi:hypothetical protein
VRTDVTQVASHQSKRSTAVVVSDVPGLTPGSTRTVNGTASWAWPGIRPHSQSTSPESGLHQPPALLPTAPRLAAGGNRMSR